MYSIYSVCVCMHSYTLYIHANANAYKLTHATHMHNCPHCSLSDVSYNDPSKRKDNMSRLLHH